MARLFPTTTLIVVVHALVAAHFFATAVAQEKVTRCSLATGATCYQGTPEECEPRPCDFFVPDEESTQECTSRSAPCLQPTGDSTCGSTSCTVYEPLQTVLLSELEDKVMITGTTFKFQLVDTCGDQMWAQNVYEVKNDLEKEVQLMISTCLPENADADTQIMITGGMGVASGAPSENNREMCSSDQPGCEHGKHDNVLYHLMPGKSMLVSIGYIDDIRISDTTMRRRSPPAPPQNCAPEATVVYTGCHTGTAISSTVAINQKPTWVFKEGLNEIGLSCTEVCNRAEGTGGCNEDGLNDVKTPEAVEALVSIFGGKCGIPPLPNNDYPSIGYSKLGPGQLTFTDQCIYSNGNNSLCNAAAPKYYGLLCCCSSRAECEQFIAPHITQTLVG